MCERVEAVARELAEGKLRMEPGKAGWFATRDEVRRAWSTIGDILIRRRQPELAAQVSRFAAEIRDAQTEKEMIGAELSNRAREKRIRQQPIR
jgi:hypothetical protein